MKVLIIDDEPKAIKLISSYLKHFANFELVATFRNGLKALEFLNTNTVDVVFLDINMPKLSGFDFLKTISNPPKVIVTTAYKEFAIEGYELNISDYLLKPFSFERFVKAINKTISNTSTIQEVISKTVVTKVDETSSSFFLKGDKKHHQVHLNDILFIEAYGHYTKVYLENEMILSTKKISSFDAFLPEKDFFRTHKSFIVAKKKINQIEGNRILINTHKIPIGQTYKSQVNTLFN